MSTGDTVRERALGFLGAHHVMTLATSEPWAAAVFYVNDGFALHFLSAATTRHSVRLAADPRVAVTVQDDVGDWQVIRGLQLEGTVAPVPGPSLERVKALYARKFPFVGAGAPAPIARALERVRWYTVTPSGVWLVDNARGFAHRDYLALEGGQSG